MPTYVPGMVTFFWLFFSVVVAVSDFLEFAFFVVLPDSLTVVFSAFFVAETVVFLA